jgi:transcriptional regulator with XRE-family HTH domain
MRSVGNRLEERRKELGLSQKELAQRAGTTQPTLSALESGKSKETNFIARLAQQLGVHALWLETGQGPRLVSDPIQEIPKLSAAEQEILDLMQFLTGPQIEALKTQMRQQKKENSDLLKALLPLKKRFAENAKEANVDER